MKKTIWKFPLQPIEKTFIKMPKFAEVLTVQTQHDNPCLWALVYPDNELEERCFEVFGTGHPVPYDMGVERKYIATFQLMSGSLVFHVFERF